MSKCVAACLLPVLLAVPVWASRTGPDIFSGNTSFSDDELLAYLAARNQTVDAAAVRSTDEISRTERLLRQFYQDRGFPLAKVWLENRPPAFSFRIVEGPKAELGWIVFQGNRAVADSTLSRLLGLEGLLDFNELEEGLDRIRSHYRDNGRFRAEVGQPRVEVVETERRDHFPLPFRKTARPLVRMTIQIDEGPEFRFGRVSMPDLLKEIQSAVPARGDLYRESDLTKLKSQAALHFLNQGKLIREFQVYQRVRDDDKSVDVDVVCHLFPQLVVKKIEFVGNRRYPDSFYRRELTFEEEKFLDPRKIEESLPALFDTGVLTSISGSDVELAIREKDLEADVIIHLHERDRQKVLFSLGPDGLGGLEASAFYSIVNLLGLGEKLGVDVKVGSSTSELAVSLASRYLLGTQIPASLALRFFRRNTRFELPGADDRINALFSSSAGGVTAAGQYRIRPDQTVSLGVGAERITAPIRSDHLSLAPGWRLSRANGDGTTDTFEVSSRFSLFGGQSDSWNLRADVAYGRSLPDGDLRTRAFSYRLHVAHAGFFGDPEPLFERILKDDRELRGFSFTAGPWAVDEQGAGPIGGDSLFTFGSEYQLPLRDRLALVPFFDSGVNLASASPSRGRLIPQVNRVWRASLGTEIRFRVSKRLPVTRLIFSWNPLRLDETVSTPAGLARLRDSALSFKVGLF